MLAAIATRPGSRFPPGATVVPRRRQLLHLQPPRHAGSSCCSTPTATAPSRFRSSRSQPEHNRTFFFWHVFVEGLPPGTCYTWRADGPQDTPQTGRAFNPRKELLDPWARAVSDALWDRRQGSGPAATTGHASIAGHRDRADAARREADAPRRPRRRGDLRAARRRLHAPSFERREASGDLRWPDREDPLPGRARRDPRRAAAGDGIRRAGRARSGGRAGAAQLLGLQHPQLLQPAPAAIASSRRARRTSSARWSMPCTTRASACCSTWCSTTPPRAARTAR